MEQLKASLSFTQACLLVSKSEDFKGGKITRGEVEDVLRGLKEGISVFRKVQDTRNWLRYIQLYGSLLTLLGRAKETIKEYSSHDKFIEEVADVRTQMLFYLVYSDAYKLLGDFDAAMVYCIKARQSAERQNLKQIWREVDDREQALKVLLEVTLQGLS